MPEINSLSSTYETKETPLISPEISDISIQVKKAFSHSTVLKAILWGGLIYGMYQFNNHLKEITETANIHNQQLESSRLMTKDENGTYHIKR